MKKFIYLPTIILIVISLLFCGCSNTSENDIESKATVIIVGNHQNAKVVNNSVLNEKIKDVYTDLGNLAFIVADGTPEIEYNEDTILGYRNKSELEDNYTKRKNNSSLWEGNYLKIQIDDLTEKINLLKANSEEVDLLQSLIEATTALDMINVTEYNMKKEIIIYDSGISTKGEVIISSELLSYDNDKIDEYLDELSESNLLPNLDNVTVSWFGIGNVDDPQSKLNNANVTFLETFWKKLIEKCGGEFICQKADFADKNTSEYKVSVVDFSIPEPEPVSEKTYNIYFKSDSDDYVDKKSANKTISNAAKEIKNSSGNWYVIGCEAGRTPDGVSELENHISTKRATKVARALRSLGVSDSQIILVALGPYDPWHIEDYTENEIWDDDIATENRKVVIVHSENESLSNNIDFIKKGIIK